jgi:hypothetical protein
LAEAGVTLYKRVEHAGPAHGESQEHRPDATEQIPLRLQERSEVQGAAAEGAAAAAARKRRGSMRGKRQNLKSTTRG